MPVTVRPCYTPYPPPFADERASARVKHVAALLDCDDSQIRRLIDSGDLEAHRIGKRGIRVYLDSVDEYRNRMMIITRKATSAGIPKPLKSKATTTANREAMAYLRQIGII